MQKEDSSSLDIFTFAFRTLAFAVGYPVQFEDVSVVGHYGVDLNWISAICNHLWLKLREKVKVKEESDVC